MKYKVVPFVAAINQADGPSMAAKQLEELINDYSAEGWEYLRLENLETYVAGSSGCFGFGATEGTTTTVSLAVFKK